jgi:hypothetical protein
MFDYHVMKIVMCNNCAIGPFVVNICIFFKYRKVNFGLSV